MAAGYKRIETRSWRTDYRGTLAIHAAKRPMDADTRALYRSWIAEGRIPVSLEPLPYGAIVAIGELVACVPTGEVTAADLRREHSFGNYAPGRWAWIFARVRRVIAPVPVRGAQGLFHVADSVLLTEYTG
jgi:hypothetical protein